VILKSADVCILLHHPLVEGNFCYEFVTGNENKKTKSHLSERVKGASANISLIFLNCSKQVNKQRKKYKKCKKRATIWLQLRKKDTNSAK